MGSVKKGDAINRVYPYMIQNPEYMDRIALRMAESKLILGMFLDRIVLNPDSRIVIYNLTCTLTT